MSKNEKIISEFGFKQLTVDDRCLFEMYRSKSDAPLSSCANFPSIIGWSTSSIPYYKVEGGALCIIFNDAVYNSWISFPPMCCYADNPPDEALFFLCKVFHAMGLPFRMYYVKEWMIPYIEKSGIITKIKYDDALSDYIYSYDDFMNYLGKSDIKYCINYFKRRFRPLTEPLSPDNMQEFLDFLKETWCPFHTCEDCVYGCMYDTLKIMLEGAEKTGLKCFMVRVEGKCVAYAGYTVCGNELEVLVKKISRAMKGITDFVHDAIMQDVGETVTQVNYTEDMGVEGMRKYKQKLSPYVLSHNYELVFEEVKD